MLQGRSEVGARVGPVTINRDDFLDILKLYNNRDKILGFQLIIEHLYEKDYLIWRIAVDNKYLEEVNKDLRLLKELFSNEKKMYQESVDMNLIFDIQIEVCNYEGLVKNRRTGKLRNVIDRRSVSERRSVNERRN
jgi:phenylacetate-CoA ligase